MVAAQAPASHAQGGTTWQLRAACPSHQDSRVPRATQELRHKAGTHRLIRGDAKRLGGALIPLPPSALLRCPWEVFLGSFSWAALDKACLFTWRQTFNEVPSLVGIIMLRSRNCPHYLLLILNRVFLVQRITLRNPSPDPARRSMGVVQKCLQCLGLNIDTMM